MPGNDGGAGPPRRRWRRWQIAAELVLGVVFVVIAVLSRHYIVRSFDHLGNLNLMWMGLAIVVEAISHVAFALSRRHLLRASGHQIGAGPVLAITFGTNAVAISLPFVGSGLATVYAYRLFRGYGIDLATIGWALAVAGIFSSSSLALVLVGGALTSGAPLASAAGFGAAAAFLLPGVVVLLALRYDRARKLTIQILIRLVHAIERLLRRLEGRSRAFEGLAARLEGVPGEVEGFIDRVASIRLPALQYAEAFALSVLNWIADAAALAFAVRATGQRVPWHSLLLVYSAGVTAGSTGVTPGGLGVVDLALTAALTVAGLTAAGAFAAVIAYRLVSFWFVIITEWIVMFFLSHRRRAPGGRRGGQALPRGGQAPSREDGGRQ
jgi:putative heme transporter